MASNLCYAFILVKNDLPGEIKILYDEAPIIIISWRHLGKTLLVGCIYRPHAKSTVYERDFSKDMFAERIEAIRDITAKPPAIICGDFNIDLDKAKLAEDKRICRLINRTFYKFTVANTGNTFERNCNSRSTRENIPTY